MGSPVAADTANADQADACKHHKSLSPVTPHACSPALGCASSMLQFEKASSEGVLPAVTPACHGLGMCLYKLRVGRLRGTASTLSRRFIARPCCVYSLLVHVVSVQTRNHEGGSAGAAGAQNALASCARNRGIDVALHCNPKAQWNESPRYISV